MAKSRKKKWLLIISLLLVFGLAGGYVGGKYLLRRRVMSWRQQGIAASKAGDHVRASDYLVRYLQRRPDDVEALDYYIRSRELAELPNGQHLAETVSALKLLLSDDPQRIDQRVHLLELYARLERRPEAIDTANAILKVEPKNLRALKLKTEVLLSMRNFRDALQTADEWATLTPDDIQPYLDHIAARQQLADQAGQPADDIIEYAENLRKANPDNAKFELISGFAYAQSGDEVRVQRAGELLKMAAAHPNLSEDFALVLVDQLDNLGLSQDSLGVLEKMLKNGAGPDIRHTLGKRYWELGQWSQAAEALSDVDLKTGDPTLLALRAISHAGANQMAESTACRNALASRNQAAARAWTLILSRVIDAGNPDDKSIIRECQSALITDRTNVYLQYYFGDSCARLGETDMAISAWRNAAAIAPTWTVPGSRLVEILLQKGMPEQALSVASLTARRNPTQAAAVITLARAWSAQIQSGGASRADDLLKLVDEVQKQIPGEDQTLFIRVQLLAQQSDKPESKAEAIETARSALDRKPPPSELLLTALAGLSLRYDLGIQIELLDKSQALHGITPNLAYARAMNALVSGGAPAALKQFDDQAKQAQPKDQVAWQIKRAQLLDASDNAEAKPAWIALGDAHPDDLDIQRMAIDARATRGDWDFQTRSIERLKKLAGGGGMAWRLAEARLYVQGARTDADYEKGALLLTEILKEDPESAESHVLLAQALVQLKRTDGAIEHLTVASKLSPASVPIALQLASLLQSRGDFEQVSRELDRVAPQLRSAAERREAAMMLSQTGKSDQAVKLLESPKSGQPNDLMLAVLYKQQGQYDKAEAVARKLLEHPDPATVQFTAILLASEGRRAEADQVMTKLDGLKLDPGIKEMAWASYLSQMGLYRDAASHFENATKEAPTNQAAWCGLAVAQLVSGHAADVVATFEAATKAIPNDQGLATLRAESNLLRDCAGDSSLLSIVLEVIRSPSTTQPELQLLHLAHDAKLAKDYAGYSAGLKQLIIREPTLVAARTQLAECDLAMGRVDAALAHAKEAMAAFPTSPAAARLVANIYISQRQWKRAREATDAWRKRLGETNEEVDVTSANVDLGLRDYSAAIRRLAPYVSLAKESPELHGDLLSPYAAARINAGSEQDAADLVLPISESTPVLRMIAVRAVLQIDDGAAAISWVGRLQKALPTDADLRERLALAVVCQQRGAGMSGREKEPKLQARAAELFAQLAESPTVSGDILLVAGSNAEAMGDASAAEDYYRRALELNPKLWVAQNNLAALLSRGADKLTEAVQLASAAVASMPDEPEVHDTLAMAQAKSGDFKSAATSAAEAAKLAPNNPKWRIREAQYLVQAGEVMSATNVLNSLDVQRQQFDQMPPTLKKDLDDVREQIKKTRLQ